MKLSLASAAAFPTLIVALRNNSPVANVLRSGSPLVEGLGAEQAEDELYSNVPSAESEEVEGSVASAATSADSQAGASADGDAIEGGLVSQSGSAGAVPLQENGGLPSVGVPSAGMPSAPAGVPSTGGPPVSVPPVDVPSAGIPSADIPSAGIPSADIPSAGVPSAGIPSAGVPSADIPSAGIPSAGVPSAGVPSAGIPSAAIPSPPAKVSSAGLRSQQHKSPKSSPMLSAPPVVSQGRMVSVPPVSSHPLRPAVPMAVAGAKRGRGGALRSTNIHLSARNNPTVPRAMPPVQHTKPRRNPDGSRIDCASLLKGRRRLPSIAAFNTLVLALSGRSKGKDPDKMASKALEVLWSSFSQSQQGMDWVTFYDMTDCAVTPDGRTFLMQMIAMGYNAALDESITFRLRAGPLRELVDVDGNNVLHLAVKSGNADVCEKIIAKATAEDDHAIDMFEAKNKAGSIPLDLAKMQKQLDIIRLLQSRYTVLEATRELSQSQ